MKPCSRNRKPIAWLALDELAAPEAAALRDHFAHCEGCRSYWEEISTVTGRLSTAQPDSRLELSGGFHRSLSQKLQAHPRSSLADLLRQSCDPGLRWRVALPAGALLVCAILAWLTLRHHSTVSPPHLPPVQVASNHAGDELSPTLANYRAVAHQSLNQLDELLLKQGSKVLPPAPAVSFSAEAVAPPF